MLSSAMLKKFGGLVAIMATSNTPLSSGFFYVAGMSLRPVVKEIRKMRTAILRSALALAVVFGSTYAFAQEGQGNPQWQSQRPPMTVDQRLDMMSKQLNLTGDQQEKIKPILQNEMQQMDALRADTSVSQQDRWGKMQEIRKSTAEQIKPILNADQQQKYAEMMQRRGRPGGPGGGQSAPPPPQQ
jgi:Spy/CpxP family protein refolding chaperone